MRGSEKQEEEGVAPLAITPSDQLGKFVHWVPKTFTSAGLEALVA